MGVRSEWRGPHPGPSGSSSRRRGEGSRGKPPSGTHDGEHEPAPASSRPHAGRQRREWPPSEPQRYPNVLPAANPVASPPFLGRGLADNRTQSRTLSLPEGRRQRAPESSQQRPRPWPSTEPEHLLYSKNPFQADIYSADEFRMYWFKVWPCYRADSHGRTGCPYAHPGEYARRRDPRTSNYSCFPCGEFPKGGCQRGDSCHYAHGLFECWLHPASYRTRWCEYGTGCSRRVCFFAHTREEIRTPPSKMERATPSLLPGSPSWAATATAPFADGVNHNSLGWAQQQQQGLQSHGSRDLRPGIGVPSVVGLPSFELGSGSQDPDVSWANSLLNSSSSSETRGRRP